MLRFKISREVKNKTKMNMRFDKSSLQGTIIERDNAKEIQTWHFGMVEKQQN